MACCGRGQSLEPVPADKRPVSPTSAIAQGLRPARDRVFFQYIGPTAMTAIGRATGNHYRFERPGTRVAVDAADRASMMQVPNLRQV